MRCARNLATFWTGRAGGRCPLTSTLNASNQQTVSGRRGPSICLSSRTAKGTKLHEHVQVIILAPFEEVGTLRARPVSKVSPDLTNAPNVNRGKGGPNARIFGLTPRAPKRSRGSHETVNYLGVDPLRKPTYGARNVSKSLRRLPA